MHTKPPTASVLIATYNRPDYLRTCLEHLALQTVELVRVIVVDSSSNDLSEVVAREFGAVYLRNPLGRGHTATSRMLGVAAAGDVDVIAFIDDDAYADPDWLEQLLRRYEDPRIGGVGGRASNGQPGEELEGLGAIGRFLPDGTLTGHFAAQPPADVEVDHLLGANMSLRRTAVEAVGGIQDYYPGTCLREESEIALRLRRAGYGMIYAPDAFVRHVGGTYAKGRRFDGRYSYYAQRNHIVLLARVVGRRDPRFRRYLRVAWRQFAADVAYAGRSLTRGQLVGDGSILSGVGRGSTKAASTAAGIVVGLALVWGGKIPQARARATVPETSGAESAG